jgi:hypothetical protein
MECGNILAIPKMIFEKHGANTWFFFNSSIRAKRLSKNIIERTGWHMRREYA